MLRILVAFFVFVAVANARNVLESNKDENESPETDMDMDPTFVGDMKLTQKQLEAFEKGQDLDAAPESGNAFAIHNSKERRWKDGIIPYTFDCSVEHMPSVIESVKLAMSEWENKTCIRFVPRTTQTDYVNFFRGSGCWAYVGRIGRQSLVSVGKGCHYQHVMAHEIGHVIGFYHEQNRMDRDSYVQIIWENIYEPLKRAFKFIKHTYSLGEPYDYASIMHYPWTAFSLNGSVTMKPLKPVKIQPYQHISEGDSKQVSLMYKGICKDVSKSSADPESIDRMPEKRDASIPCVDNYKDCPGWARMGYCPLGRTKRVKKECPLSCQDHCKAFRTTTPRPTTIPPTTAKPIPRVFMGTGKLCKNVYSKCPMWAARGDCKRIPEYMRRICPQECNRTSSEVGCDPRPQKPPGTCAEPLGIAFNGTGSKIPDSSIIATSEFSSSGGPTAPTWVAAATSGRLYFTDDHTNHKIGAWCVQSQKLLKAGGQYLQVDLGLQKNIQYIATQGRPLFYERVSKFKVKYSNDGIKWSDYTEDSSVKQFQGNCDHFTPVLNKFKNIIKARYFRYYPIEANFPCVRMELYGC